jgi:hypothetical protein
MHMVTILKTKLLQDVDSITPFWHTNLILQTFEFYPYVFFNMTKIGNFKSRL